MVSTQCLPSSLCLSSLQCARRAESGNKASDYIIMYMYILGTECSIQNGLLLHKKIKIHVCTCIYINIEDSVIKHTYLRAPTKMMHMHTLMPKVRMQQHSAKYLRMCPSVLAVLVERMMVHLADMERWNGKGGGREEGGRREAGGRGRGRKGEGWVWMGGVQNEVATLATIPFH